MARQDPMAQWRQHTRLANHHFAEGNHLAALPGYRQALRLAEQQLLSWQDANEVVAALVVACHNLADLMMAMGEESNATTLLCQAHQQLLQLSHSPSCRNALRVAALNHSRHTQMELLAFLRKRGPNVVIQACLDQCHCQGRSAHTLH
ncbi:DUF2753 domain-containing protein [Aeromonas sp. BIGb0445]|uniref:DUF2753 domain-containing protein n=1 Tax=Aeromonas sp. BIGb0445 TaxID=2940593 RepID=UPI0021691FEA|nr:DUF2753 domain-containing protein [Aeromonas sp. BIGb0445]MCS3461363.1 hypothetical protein [Aeromonas sp. BIGb0445]